MEYELARGSIVSDEDIEKMDALLCEGETGFLGKSGAVNVGRLRMCDESLEVPTFKVPASQGRIIRRATETKGESRLAFLRDAAIKEVEKVLSVESQVAISYGHIARKLAEHRPFHLAHAFARIVGTLRAQHVRREHAPERGGREAPRAVSRPHVKGAVAHVQAHARRKPQPPDLAPACARASRRARPETGRTRPSRTR